MENYVFDKSLLTDKEQQEILFALQGLKATNSTDTDQVLSKLTSLFGNENPYWIEVDFSNWSNSKDDKVKFTLLKDAILNHILVYFQYFNSKGEQSLRIVEPRQLVFKGQAWYLYGVCREKKEYRYFKITRIHALSLGSDTFIPLPLKKEDDTSKHDVDQKQSNLIDVLLKIDAALSYRALDEFPREDIEFTKEGYLLVHTKPSYNPWLIGYLMSFEDGLEVLEPISLRTALLDKYKNLVRKYDS